MGEVVGEEMVETMEVVETMEAVEIEEVGVVEMLEGVGVEMLEEEVEEIKEILETNFNSVTLYVPILRTCLIIVTTHCRLYFTFYAFFSPYIIDATLKNIP